MFILGRHIITLYYILNCFQITNTIIVLQSPSVAAIPIMQRPSIGLKRKKYLSSQNIK